MVKMALLGLLVLFLLIQLIPVDRSNPPVQGAIQVPEDVMTILRTSCYDCHSNETRWPWYSRIAPISWLIAEHVQDGRKHLNFSTWEQYDAKKKVHKMEDLIDVLKEGEMPLPSYLIMHSETRLTPEKTERLIQWAQQLRQSLVTGSPSTEEHEADEHSN
ncbi:MAG: heme-binding domain-containing protein [Calditrichaeota bacterium]|nr:heme-binding domain-containing protein [Calditrichota bacterium]